MPAIDRFEATRCIREIEMPDKHAVIIARGRTDDFLTTSLRLGSTFTYICTLATQTEQERDGRE